MARSRKAVWQLGQAVRALSSSSAVASVPAPTIAQSGFLSQKSKTATLDIPLAGYEEVKPASISPSMPPTSITTLSNGIRVGSQDVPSPVSTIAVLVNAGSAYEDSDYEGASQLLEAMIFKGTTKRSYFATVRQAENYGISLSAYAQRESLAFFATAPRDHMPAAAELLFDSVANPNIMYQALEDTKARIMKENESLIKDPNFIASEGIVSAAYNGSLARPSYWQGHPINSDQLQDFHKTFFTKSNSVVAAAGVDITTTTSLTEELFATLPDGMSAAPSPSMYVGGGSSEHSTSSCTAVVAFESTGWSDLKTSILNTVIGYMLGGGADFSSGGPGKGMHSRLYSQVLARNNWVSNCTVYNNTFEHTGLFGITMSTPHVNKGSQLVDMLCTQLETLANTTPSSEEVERAKRACESSVLAALEMPGIVAEDIARQIISYGKRIGIEEFKKEVQGIDGSTIKAHAQKMLSGKPSGMLIGDQAVMPKFGDIASRFS